MRTKLLFLLLLASVSLQAQTVLMVEEPKLYNLQRPTYGPNMMHYTHLYLSYGMFVSPVEGTGVDIDHTKSLSFDIGWRYKMKFCKYFAIGSDIHFAKSIFDIKQNATKQLFNNVLHEEELLKLNKMGLDIFFRFNVGRRGNSVGKFMDIAIYGDYITKSTHLYVDKVDAVTANYYAKERQTVYSSLTFVENVEYGLKMRLGIGRWVLNADYRLSDLFTDDFKQNELDVELPRLSVGLQIGLHQ